VTFTAALALLKDLAILAALGFILWYVTHAEHNADQLKDLKANLAQVQQTQTTMTRWQEEETHARTKADSALDALNTRVDALNRPLIVRVPSNTYAALPRGASAPGSSPAPNACGTQPGSLGTVRQVDIGPMLADIERRYGTALIECQRLIDSWPK
jgi:hypothetical protein